MQTRYFSLGLGIVYLLVGIVAFVPALYTSAPVDAPHLDVTGAYGLLFDLFPVNILHDLVHILVGLGGIAAAARLGTARIYGQLLFLVFGALTIFGFLPELNTLWGHLPLSGDDTWLHAATALVSGYFGFVAGEEQHLAPAPAHAGH